jgi:membrane protease YdiL (CAAX protease family)
MIHGIPSNIAVYLVSYNDSGIQTIFIFGFILLFHKNLLANLSRLKTADLVKIIIFTFTAIVFIIWLFNLIVFQSTELIFHSPFDYPTIPNLLSTLLIGPIFEEMLYRYSLIYDGRVRWLRIATILTSIPLFTFGHIVNANGNLFLLYPYLAIGIVLTLVYLRKRNLWESIIAHITYNCFVILLAALF